MEHPPPPLLQWVSPLAVEGKPGIQDVSVKVAKKLETQFVYSSILKINARDISLYLLKLSRMQSFQLPPGGMK